MYVGVGPTAHRNNAGIWIDPSDPAFSADAIGQDDGGDMPAIYLFSNARDGDGIAYAMAEDGTVLGTHWCSHWGYMRHDLHDRSDRKSKCEEHYPDGYRLVVLGPDQAPPQEVIDRSRAQAAADEQNDDN
jgi:hypothetical protein